MANSMTSNSISCQNVDDAFKQCMKLGQITGEICDAMRDFCSIADDTQALGANIAEAMPIVVALRDAVKQAQQTSEEHIRKMGGYLKLLQEDSEQSINLD